MVCFVLIVAIFGALVTVTIAQVVATSDSIAWICFALAWPMTICAMFAQCVKTLESRCITHERTRLTNDWLHNSPRPLSRARVRERVGASDAEDCLVRMEEDLAAEEWAREEKHRSSSIVEGTVIVNCVRDEYSNALYGDIVLNGIVSSRSPETVPEDSPSARGDGEGEVRRDLSGAFETGAGGLVVEATAGSPQETYNGREASTKAQAKRGLGMEPNVTQQSQGMQAQRADGETVAGAVETLAHIHVRDDDGVAAVSL